jgi:hypothetical protein
MVAKKPHAASVFFDTLPPFDKGCIGAFGRGERYKEISQEFRRIAGDRGPINGVLS